MNEIMEKHLGKTECFSYYKLSAGFIPKNYIAHFKDADVNTGEYAAESGEAVINYLRTFLIIKNSLHLSADLL